MVEDIIRLVANLIGRVREVSVNGRHFIVAPATSIVPGVLPGSQGPLYYPPDEIARNVDDWNAVPMVVRHPIVNGRHVSARNPRILAESGIGHVYESTFNGSLQHELWFDIEATDRVDNRIIPKLRKGEPIELSTGLYTHNEDHEERVHNTASGPVRYSRTARNYRPDHIAILPDEVGACPISAGCGVLVNECVLDEKGVCVNCGGEGGTPGPCPSGKHDRHHAEIHEATKEAHKATREVVGIDSSNLAHQYAEAAKEHSEKGEHNVASIKHKMAAIAHGSSAASLRKEADEVEAEEVSKGSTKFGPRLVAKNRTNADKHEKAAKLHRLAASLHHDRHLETNSSCLVEDGFCLNCGGEGGKPGPCPSGSSHGGGSGSGKLPKLSTDQGSLLGRIDGHKAEVEALDTMAKAMRTTSDPKEVEKLRSQWQSAYHALVKKMASNCSEANEVRNCGGEGSNKPGPCPSGHHKDTESAHIHEATKEANKASEELIPKITSSTHKDEIQEELDEASKHSESGNHRKAEEYHTDLADAHTRLAKLSRKHFRKDIATAHEEAANLHRLAAALHHDKHLETNSQPSSDLDITPEKACKILKDGEVNGNPLTDAQKGMFGAKCGERGHTGNSECPVCNQGAIDMNRDQTINWLVANCSCWKGAKGKAALSELSDNELVELEKTEKRNQAVFNTLQKGVVHNGITLTMNSAGEIVANDAMPCPSGMDKDKWSGMSTEDKKKHLAGNVQPQMTLAQMIDSFGSQQEKATWAGILAANANMKAQLIANMTAHLPDGPQKQAVIANLSSKEVPELQTLAMLNAPVPVNNLAPQYGVPNPLMHPSMPQAFPVGVGGYGVPMVGNMLGGQPFSDADTKAVLPQPGSYKG